MADRSVPILIIGAGPCGLGAAYRLHEQGHADFLVVEAAGHPGGLATSYLDEQGFTWDVGGHVVHSHYEYFDRVFHQALDNNYYQHQRESWVWMLQRFIPYPFQNNLRYLPKKIMQSCVDGLLALTKKTSSKPTNFREWILASFGDGIAKHFLFPYNLKLWQHPLEKMTAAWVGDRVATVDINRTLDNIAHQRDDVSWGPNHVFYFPKTGGTGTIWRRIASTLPRERFMYHTTVEAIDVAKHTARLSTGEHITYTHLISSMPLNQLVKISRLPTPTPAALTKTRIKQICTYSSVHVIGIGLTGRPHKKLATKCWMYFPESTVPFFRVTVFSNYSPANVPDASQHWSLMCEVSESMKINDSEQEIYSDKKAQELIKKVIAGLRSVKLITANDQVISTWHHHAKLGYPTPTIARDKYLHAALKSLEKWQIYSRGRFGAWKYEVSNMDHTFMQGVEVANRIMTSDPTAEITVWHPNQVNHR